MALVRWQATVQDEKGDYVVNPSITVRNAADNSLADIYDDAGSAKANPFLGTSEGFVTFKADPGRYIIEGVKDAETAQDWIVDIVPPFDVAGTYGAIGDGLTNDTAAIDALPDGEQVDMLDKTYLVDAIPENFQPRNATFKVGSLLTNISRRDVLHPLDGIPVAVKAGVAGTIHPGPIFYLANDAKTVSVFAQSVSHAPHAGMVVMARYSDDDGLTSNNQVSIYQDDTKIIRAMIGGEWGDGYALIISLTDGTTRSHVLLTMDADGAWSVPSVLSGITDDLVSYGKVHRWPSSAGGSDTDGYIFYAYSTSTTPKKAVSIRTSDSGASWTQSDFYIADGLEIPTEIDLGKVPDQSQWVGYLRFSGSNSNPREWFKAFKTTNMYSATFYDTSLESGGSENKVGQPPFVLVDGGRYYLYTPFREDWTSTDAYEQGLYYYEATAAELWANNGSFPNPVPRFACVIPSRALGMMAAVKTPRGWICQMRGAENEYPNNSSQPVNSQLIILSKSDKVVLSGQICGDFAPRENKIDNPIFTFAESGTSFTGITSNGDDVIERWQAWPSGGTMNFERVSLPLVATRSIPARPRYGMRITSSVPNGDMGFQQVHYGRDKVMEFSDKVVTVTIWGYGTPGNFAGLRAIAIVNTGSPEYSVIDDFSVPFNTGGLWYTTARLYIGDLSGLSEGSNDRIAFRFANPNDGLDWDATICAIKLEIGDFATPIETPDFAKEEAKCRAYFEKIGGNGSLIGTTFRDASTQTKCFVNYERKVKTPTVSFSGVTSDLTFDSVSGALTGVAYASSGKIGRKSAEIVFTHDSTTGPAGGHLSSANDTAIIVRC